MRLAAWLFLLFSLPFPPSLSFSLGPLLLRPSAAVLPSPVPDITHFGHFLSFLPSHFFLTHSFWAQLCFLPLLPFSSVLFLRDSLFSSSLSPLLRIRLEPSSRSPSPLSSSLPLTFARVSSPAISHALCPELLRFRNLRISPRQPRPPRKVQAARSHAQRASGEGSAAPADGASPRAASRALLSTCEELAGGSIAPQRLQPGTDFGGKQRKRLSLIGLRVEHDAGGAAGGQSEAGAPRGSSSSPSSHPSSLPQRISHLVALTPGPGGDSLPASSTWGPFPAGCAPLAPAGVRPPRRHHRQCLCLW